MNIYILSIYLYKGERFYGKYESNKSKECYYDFSYNSFFNNAYNKNIFVWKS